MLLDYQQKGAGLRLKSAGAAMGVGILMVLASCQDASLLDTSSSSKAIVVTWSVPQDARSAVGAGPSTYRVTLTSATGSVTTQTGLRSLSATFTNPAAGVYTVKVQGMDDSGTVIVEGVGSIDFSATRATASLVLTAVTSTSATGQIAFFIDDSSLTSAGGASLALTTVSPSGAIGHPSPAPVSGGFMWSEPSAEVGTWGLFANIKWGIKAAFRTATFDVVSGKNSPASIVFKDSDALNTYVPVTQITLGSPSFFLGVGKSATLAATLIPSTASNPLVAWTSSNPNVATVSSQGVVTAVSSGAATIRATSADHPSSVAESLVQVGLSVRYDANGGSGTVPTDNTVYAEGSMVSLASAPGLSMPSSTLAGWTTDPAESGESESYAADGRATLTMGSKDVVLYAVWLPNSLKWTSSGATITITGYSSPPPKDWMVPPGVTGIADSAFANCNTLKTVSLPSSVVTLGKNALGGCPLLNSITVNPDNPVYQSLQGVVFSKDATTLVAAPGSLGPTYTVPAGVTAIAPYAFFDCGNLRSIEFPSTLIEIGSWAFFVSGLQSVVLPSGLQTIAANAFAGSTSLARVELPDSLKTIGGNAFANCIAISELSIPASVTALDSYALGGCSSLSRVTLSAAVPPHVSADSFEAVSASLQIHLPSPSAVAAYRADAGWSAYSSQLVSP